MPKGIAAMVNNNSNKPSGLLSMGNDDIRVEMMVFIDTCVCIVHTLRVFTVTKLGYRNAYGTFLSQQKEKTAHNTRGEAESEVLLRTV